MREKLYRATYKIEDNFFLTVVRHGLTMMIPFLLVGGIACALLNLPFSGYQAFLALPQCAPITSFLTMINQGTYGLFSIAVVVTISLSYGMERNERPDQIAMYLVVSLGAYGTQLNLSSEDFNLSLLGVSGCFSALLIALFSCYFFTFLRKCTAFSLSKYTAGMVSICASAIHTILPAAIIIGFVALCNQFLISVLHVANLPELFSLFFCALFEHLDNDFWSGLLYTLLLHLLWLFGMHGSNILEPVAQTTFAFSPDTIFSKSFFDTYVVMGGCGTTVCVLIALLLFFRRDRMGRLAKLASFTVIFNLNEVLNFGIPIILNPILGIPFLLTPVAVYIITYGATYFHLVPPVMQNVPWTTPVLFSGYFATGSIRGSILQFVCIAAGIAIYLPFLRLHRQSQESYARELLKRLVTKLQEMEEKKEAPNFLARTDKLGLTAHMLLNDLKEALKNHSLYLLYQPQVDSAGNCIGSEALLRWNHPTYGLIYPPLTIALAKEGELLPSLESQLFDMTGQAIRTISDVYPKPFKISMNITASSLLWDIEECIAECLQKYDIPAEALWLEITEQDVLLNSDDVIQKLKRLRDKGHTLLIDDFGMGHTSLLYLQSNFFKVVKLDGSLIRTLLDQPTNQKIVSSIAELGKKLDVEVIAEYVETKEQQKKLLELGCHWYQGYLYSRPIPLEEFIAYLKG